MVKEDGALLTIGEVSDRFGIAAHILRYWESKFAGLRPLQRSGNRRYYRPEDVAMVARINQLLNEEGYTVAGAVRLLSGRGQAIARPSAAAIPAADGAHASAASVAGAEMHDAQAGRSAPANAALEGAVRDQLLSIRHRLNEALARSA